MNSGRKRRKYLRLTLGMSDRQRRSDSKGNSKNTTNTKLSCMSGNSSSQVPKVLEFLEFLGDSCMTRWRRRYAPYIFYDFAPTVATLKGRRTMRHNHLPKPLITFPNIFPDLPIPPSASRAFTPTSPTTPSAFKPSVQ